MAFKFSNQIAYSRLFAEVLLPQLSKIDSKYVLVPVPLHPSRLRKRGYNQAYEMAIELAKLSARTINTSLKRNKNTQMQAQLKLEQRAQNVKQAFSIKKPLKQKYLILIDDVMTSGNTLNECAKTLRKNGAIDVKVMVFARKFL
jgi:ComF family protein